MNIKDFFTHIYPRSLSFKLARRGLIDPPGPVTLTFSVTHACQSRCKTCNIWKIYREKDQRPNNELTIEEIEKIFRSVGPVYFFNITGGEPFLRNDLPEIVEAALDHLHPRIIHAPTNGIDTDRVTSATREILNRVRKRGLNLPVTIKPSIDGVGPKHDEIRGVPGNWEKLMATIAGLKELETEYPNFHLELGTVVSNFNKNDLEDIEDFVHGLGVQSYRNEIAQQGEEFQNIGEPITPAALEYARLVRGFATKIRKTMRAKKSLARMTESLRLVYYDLAVRIVQEKRQILPCFAGISNVHLTPGGELWPCSVLGHAKPLGNLRETNYNFREVWHSEQASRVRRSIRNRECACPLANQAYSNMICHTPSLIKAAWNMMRY